MLKIKDETIAVLKDQVADLKQQIYKGYTDRATVIA